MAVHFEAATWSPTGTRQRAAAVLRPEGPPIAGAVAYGPLRFCSAALRLLAEARVADGRHRFCFACTPVCAGPRSFRSGKILGARSPLSLGKFAPGRARSLRPVAGRLVAATAPKIQSPIVRKTMQRGTSVVSLKWLYISRPNVPKQVGRASCPSFAPIALVALSLHS